MAKPFSAVALSFLSVLGTPSHAQTTLAPLGDLDATVWVGQASRAPASTDLLLGGSEYLASEIYQSTLKLGRTTVNWAIPAALGLGARYFLRDIPLDKEVRARLYAQVSASDFVDQTLPFVLALKDRYTAPAEFTKNDFNAHIRASLQTKDFVPGLQHSLFRWNPPRKPTKSEERSKKGFAINPDLAAKVLTIYDILFLRDKTFKLGAPPRQDKTTVDAVKPLMREILSKAVEQMDPKADATLGLKAWLGDERQMETLTLSAIEFITAQVHKHYAQFIQSLYRKEALARFLNSSLDSYLKDSSKVQLWQYLSRALNQRRYAVHVVVDGLQGELVRSLAQGDPNQPFIHAVLREMEEGREFKAPIAKMEPTPEQTNRFLEYFAKKGYRHPEYLKFFKSKLKESPRSMFANGISTTPTISVRNLPVAMMGAPVSGPGSIGLPNFHFVDRPTDRAYYFYGNDALYFEKITRMNGASTMFERMGLLNTLGCNTLHERGAKVSYDGMLNLVMGEKSRDFGDLLCVREIETRAENELVLRTKRLELLKLREILGNSIFNPIHHPSVALGQARQLIQEIADLEDQGMPQYFQYYNPFPDHFAHFTGPFSDEILSPSGELNRLDYWLGRIDRAYQRAGVAGRTLFGIVGDHGLAPVFQRVNPEEVVFEPLNQELKKRGIAEIKIKKISSDEGQGPKMNHPEKPETNHGFDVIVASTAGGNYMLDFFKDQGSGWIQQPKHADLVKWKTLGGATFDVVTQMVSSLGHTLEYLVVREGECSINDAHLRLVATGADGKRVDEFVIRRGDRTFYKPVTDLLQVRSSTPYLRAPSPTEKAERQALLEKCVDRAELARSESWCTAQEWRALSRWTPKPDAVNQIAHLYDSDLPGTVNLFPRKHVGYNTVVPGRHAGESFHEKDAFVGFYGANLNSRPGGRALAAVVNGSVPVTLFEYVTGVSTAKNPSGWGYDSLHLDLFDDLPEPRPAR